MISCADCKFTEGQEGGALTCQRYPSPQRVARSYWCGEHAPRKAKADDRQPQTSTGQRRQGLRPAPSQSEPDQAR